MRLLTTRAPAKINLTLHVLGRRADGYHELESLVAFAGTGDTLTLDPAGVELTLSTTGPTATAAGSGADNLVLKAARALAARMAGLRLGAFHLVKRLPVAAGIGGGSSDAAAALRLLAEANGLAPDDTRVFEAAQATGADVPVCLDPRARMMCGIGERLGGPAALPPMAAVLANPGALLETRAVFAAMGLAAGVAVDRPAHPALTGWASGAALLGTLRDARNDMEPAAVALQPVVQACLDALRAAVGARLVRMSGSGATCFALFDDCRAAGAAALAIRRAHPAWWVKPTILR